MKNKLIIFTFIIFSGMFFALAGYAQAANHYIRDGANGDGSDWANALDDLPTTFVRGDTYYIADGEYSSHTFSTPVDEDKYIYIKKATTTDYGNGANWQSEYGDGQALFAPIITFTSGNWIFDGNSGEGFDGSSYGFKIDANIGLTKNCLRIDQIAGVSNIEIKHVYFLHQSNPSNTMQYAWYALYSNPTQGRNSHLIIANNLFQEGIVDITLRATDDSVIENNIFDHNYSDSAFNHGTALSLYYNQNRLTIRYNIFRDIVGTANICYFGTGTKVYGNKFYYTTNVSDALGCGGGIFSSSSGYRADNTIFYNNTISDMPYGNSGLIFYPQNGVNSTVTAYNNVWHNCNKVTLSTGQVTHAYNWYYDITSNNDILKGVNVQAGSTNPFVNSVNGDYRLSAATNAGIELVSPYNIDSLGQIRGADGVWDRGAYEYADGQTTCTQGDIDCDKDVDISDIQIAVNLFLGIENNQAKKDRADFNNDDSITIDEIQKVVNIFLGIDQ